MKKRLLITFYFSMYYLGIIPFFYWLNRKKKLVLTYHNIIPDALFDRSEHLSMSHAESTFKIHLKLIQKRFVSKCQTRCLITFDDGYKNQGEIAAKILDQYNLKGIFFISFQSMMNRLPLIIDKILMWISYVPYGTYHLLNMTKTISKYSRQAIFTDIYNKLMTEHTLWNLIEDELDKAFPFSSLKIDKELMRLRFEPFDQHDIKSLIKNGHAVGAHSWSHFPLSILPLDQQQKDFSMSMNFVKEYCNSDIYSYPFGGTAEVSPQTVRLCEEAGFKAGYMNIPYCPQWHEVNHQFTLPRSTLPNENNRFFIEAKLSGFEAFLKKVLRRDETRKVSGMAG